MYRANGRVVEKARNLSNKEDIQLSISHYLNNMAMLTNQWTPHNYKDTDRQRIYLKDIDCPPVWHDKLKEQIPASVFYLNESTGDVGGPGAVDEPNPHGPGVRLGKGVARAGDLMSCLPVPMRADNMMCYIGHEGTYTPAHREMCASLGQNIMVETSGTLDEDGKPAKPGSSIWFMTETKDRHLVSEYWLSTLGHDIEVESHFAQMNAWKAAPFTTYVVEQKVGDFILIPPLAPHQVWNRGTRTMKAAWNRTTVETLEMALDEALPRARMVCRDEQYKNNAIVLFALQRYSGLLKEVDSQKQNASDPMVDAALAGSLKIRQLQKDFKRLFTLYTKILLSETLSPVSLSEKKGQYLPFDSNVTCSYCRCNIFNRFLTCTSCVVPLENGEEDTYDICLECYAMGRSCRCLSKYRWVEQFPWADLVEKHELWRHQIILFEGMVTDKSPQSLQVERKKLEKKTLGQVCQEQLKSRPWRDPTKTTPADIDGNEEEEIQVNDDGTLKKRRKKRRSEKWLIENVNCHICKQREPKWKLAFCECGLSYCYGSLFRAFDMMPLTIMEDPDWKCPRCRKICSCAACRKDPEIKPFEPNGTILGHDTKKIADPRSVESLVDFSHSNISWVKKAGDDHPHETRRLRRRQDEAEQAKSQDPALDDNYIDEEHSQGSRGQDDAGMEFNQHGEMPIDPQLGITFEPYQPDSEVSKQRTNRDHMNLTINAKETHQQTTNGATTGGIRGPLPSVAAMLDESPPPNQGHASKSAQDPNSSLTSVEHDESRLQDSLAPIAEFNKNHDENNAPCDFVAPAAVMIRPAHEMNQNDIVYQYPDPTFPPIEVAKPPPSQQSQYPSLKPQQDSGTPIATQTGQKRKRHSEHTIIRSDMSPPPQNDANRQFHQARLLKTLAEARKNDRFIAAQGALTGRRLVVSLPIARSKLAQMDHEGVRAHRGSVGLSGDGANDQTENMIIVRSDVPQPVAHHAPFVHQVLPSHKRRVRVEPDEDFSTRKSRDRRSSGAQAPAANKPKKFESVYEELSDESEGDGLNGTIAETENPRDNQPRSRRLPGYLARRHQEEQDDEDTPTELPPRERRRRTSERRKSPSLFLSPDTPDSQHPSSSSLDTITNAHEPALKPSTHSNSKHNQPKLHSRPQRITTKPTKPTSTLATQDLSLLSAGEPSGNPQPQSQPNLNRPTQASHSPSHSDRDDDSDPPDAKAKAQAMSWAASEFTTFLSSDGNENDSENGNETSTAAPVVHVARARKRARVREAKIVIEKRKQTRTTTGGITRRVGDGLRTEDLEDGRTEGEGEGEGERERVGGAVNGDGDGRYVNGNGSGKTGKEQVVQVGAKQSIFDRPGLRGKKVRIVGKNSKTVGVGGAGRAPFAVVIESPRRTT